MLRNTPAEDRTNRPRIKRGALVRWQSRRFRVDDLERQGQDWTAVLVRPDEFEVSGTQCWFAPCREIEIEPSHV